MTVTARSLPLLDQSLLGEKRGLDPAAETETATFPLDLQLITERKAFDALETEWNDLFARAGKPTNVFQTFNFCWHWANHYLNTSDEHRTGPKLSIIIARRDDRLIMVWPLVSERVRGITQLFWMGEPVSQYGDMLIDNIPDGSDVLRAAFDFLRTRKAADILRLRRVREDANVAPLMMEINAIAADRQFAPYMDLASATNFAAFEQRYSSKTRKNRRRLARRLEEKGSREFLRFTGGAEARELATVAVRLKSDWLKSRGLLSSTITDQRMTALFGDLAEGKCRPAGCIVSALKSNGEIAAVEVSFACKARLAMHLIVFNLEFEKSGAGVLLLEQTLKDGYRDGLAICDMLAPGDAYKFDWCEKADAVTDWVKPFSLKGHLYATIYLGFLRVRIKAALKAIPQPLRRLMSHAT